ncbi:MAG: hypothetical protein LW806_12280, partial [Planctomycetaceae bacterium]|nr:hypothetical protein [Planctomycetaceae bacterium]
AAPSGAHGDSRSPLRRLPLARMAIRGRRCGGSLRRGEKTDAPSERRPSRLVTQGDHDPSVAS